jgi:hypothetical protein
MINLIEESIYNSVKSFLSGRVNELLGEMEYPIPLIEFNPLVGGGAAVPAIRLSECERTEKERVINIDTYSLTISFAAPENPEGERNCYTYAAAVVTALQEDPTLGGTVDHAALAHKKYSPPKHLGTGEDWEVMITLRITVEGIGL